MSNEAVSTHAHIQKRMNNADLNCYPFFILLLKHEYGDYKKVSLKQNSKKNLYLTKNEIPKSLRRSYTLPKDLRRYLIPRKHFFAVVAQSALHCSLAHGKPRALAASCYRGIYLEVIFYVFLFSQSHTQYFERSEY